ncbi:MAG: HAD family hydrolase [Gemmataceae bacterium]
MPLSLEQYATYLDSRKDLPWPSPPTAAPVKARSHLARLPQVRAVLWNVYGTLLAIPQGELLFEHPQAFIMNNALDKTIQEFKMWASMSRKPGQPSDYMLSQYRQLLAEQSAVPGGGERHPEVQSERVWETILKRLMQKDYKFDANFYGSMNELSRKVAYFFHASLQGTACYEDAAQAMRHVADAGLAQGLLADGQCFTPVQLARGLAAQEGGAALGELLTDGLSVLSCDVRGRKPSERLFRRAVELLQQKGIAPDETLHVGSRVAQDLVAAKRLGMYTALFAGDRASLVATPEQLREPGTRPDVLLTDLVQIAEVVG